MTGQSQRSGSEFRLAAHAKVNLTLEILGKRRDGYHNLSTIMQTLDLHDDVEVSPADTLSVECDDPSLAGESNLAFAAARRLGEAAGVESGAGIRIVKRIPVAAGLAGGSSDAAAVLRGLNRLWGLEMSHGALEEVAASVGSDVPFFLTGGTALVQGRGEHVVALPPAPIDWVVVLSPDIRVENKTRALYGRLTEGDFTRGVLTHKLAGRIRGGGDAPSQFFFNAFEPHAEAAYTGFAEAREAFKRVGAAGILMCGAGPAMFAVAPSREIGLAWQLMLERQHGMRAYLARCCQPEA
ncbi:MAG: 4-(cytidine 5'-diphospho)-2-C-methyl-D-erythritol kinase [Chloroflexota bacterium]